VGVTGAHGRRADLVPHSEEADGAHHWRVPGPLETRAERIRGVSHRTVGRGSSSAPHGDVERLVEQARINRMFAIERRRGDDQALLCYLFEVQSK